MAREYRTIVGVVPHLKVYGYEEPTAFCRKSILPMTQPPQTGLVMLLRTSLPPQPGETVTQIVASLDPAQPVFEFARCKNGWRKHGRRRG